MKDRLQSILKGKVVIVAVGSVLRGDDGLGPLLVARLEGRIKAVCIDAGTAPENYAGKIARQAPDTILIVDAVHLDRQPGACAILEKEDILTSGLTTHDSSPRLFIEYLQSQTNADIYMLGVQPENLALGADISAAVQEAINTLEKDLQEVIGA